MEWKLNKICFQKVEIINFMDKYYDVDTRCKTCYNFGKISFQNYGDATKCSSAIQDLYKTNLPLIGEKIHLLLLIMLKTVHNLEIWMLR